MSPRSPPPLHCGRGTRKERGPLFCKDDSNLNKKEGVALVTMSVSVRVIGNGDGGGVRDAHESDACI